MLLTIAAFIVLLGVLVFVHELGHYLAAKKAGIQVHRFSLGFGYPIWKMRRGETEYLICWIPLGGYVKLAGMSEMEGIEGSDDDRDVPEDRKFYSKSIGWRALVLAGGVLMNFLLAILIFASLSWFWGVQKLPEPIVASVQSDKLPAGMEALATLKTGDTFAHLGKHKISDWQDFAITLLAAPGGPTKLTLKDGRSLDVSLPDGEEKKDAVLEAITFDVPAVVGHIVSGSPASKAGLNVGDRVVRVDSIRVSTWSGLQKAVRARAEQPTELEIERDGKPITLTMVPEKSEQGQGQIGVGIRFEQERLGLGEGLLYGVAKTWEWTERTAAGLANMLTGQISPRNIGGPVMIGQATHQVVRIGLDAFLGFMAIFSVNLAVLNLLPIPVLDGGHLLFLLLEGIRGRSFAIEVRLRFMQVGMVLIFALMIWALLNDVLRLFGV